LASLVSKFKNKTKSNAAKTCCKNAKPKLETKEKTQLQ